MKLVFVHGINNEGNSSQSIIDQWSDTIKNEVGDANLFENVEIVAPFYGDELHEMTNDASRRADLAVAQGMNNADTDVQKFNDEVLKELAEGFNISADEISELSGDTVIQQGLLLDNILLPLIALIENRFPGAGDFALQFIKQANTYFEYPGAKSRIDGIVRSALDSNEPQIVIGHSLGSVATYSVLRDLNTNTKLYMTLGSPLPLKVFRKKLGPPRKIPEGVNRWVNGLDKSDPVTLGQSLNGNNFTDGIENINDVNNGFGLKAHSIEGYLSHRKIAQIIADAIR